MGEVCLLGGRFEVVFERSPLLCLLGRMRGLELEDKNQGDQRLGDWTDIR